MGVNLDVETKNSWTVFKWHSRNIVSLVYNIIS